MEEREIDLIDLIADVLSHWRGILVAMVLGGILLGGFSYVRSAKSVENVQHGTEMSVEEQLAQLEENLTETEKVSVATVMDDEIEYALKQSYIDNSVIMQMDPLAVQRTELLYKIQVEDMNQSYMLGTLYEELINGVGIGQWIEQEIGISAINADELISASAQSRLTVINGEQEATLGNDSVKVIIYYADDKQGEVLTEAVKKYVNSQHEMLAENFGNHEAILLSESAGVIMNTDLMDKQIANNNAMLTLRTNISKAKDAFTVEQQKYYDMLTMGQSEEKVEANVVVETPVAQPAPSVSVKYVLLGAILFTVFYAGIIFMMYIMNGKLRATEELQILYNIPQMGLVVKDSKKQFFIDKWISALRNHGKRQFTADQSLDLAITAVKISAAKNELAGVCLMGCDLKAGAEAVCKKLKAALEKEKLSVTILDNVLYDAEAMEKLEAVKGVVLVEKAGSTMYREIADELELVKRQGIKVLGGIVVE